MSSQWSYHVLKVWYGTSPLECRCQQFYIRFILCELNHIPLPILYMSPILVLKVVPLLKEYQVLSVGEVLGVIWELQEYTKWIMRRQPKPSKGRITFNSEPSKNQPDDQRNSNRFTELGEIGQGKAQIDRHRSSRRRTPPDTGLPGKLYMRILLTKPFLRKFENWSTLKSFSHFVIICIPRLLADHVVNLKYGVTWSA